MTTHEYLLQKYGVTISFIDASKETGLYWQTLREMCARKEIDTPRRGRKWILTTKALADYLDNVNKKEEIVIPNKTRCGYKKIV